MIFTLLNKDVLLLRGCCSRNNCKHTWLSLELINNYITVLCISIDVWKSSRSYKKPQVNMRINSSTGQWLKQQWSQHLKDVPKTVLWNLNHICLLKIPVQENHSINLQGHWMSNIILMFGVSVQLRRSISQSKKANCCVCTL